MGNKKIRKISKYDFNNSLIYLSFSRKRDGMNLGAVYMSKIIPRRWDVSPEWHFGGMVFAVLSHLDRNVYLV